MDISNIDKIRSDFYEAWETVKNILHEVYEIIFEKGNHKKHIYNWDVPIKIEIPMAPYIPRSMLNVARSNL